MQEHSIPYRGYLPIRTIGYAVCYSVVVSGILAAPARFLAGTL